MTTQAQMLYPPGSPSLNSEREPPGTFAHNDGAGEPPPTRERPTILKTGTWDFCTSNSCPWMLLTPLASLMGCVHSLFSWMMQEATPSWIEQKLRFPRTNTLLQSHVMLRWVAKIFGIQNTPGGFQEERLVHFPCLHCIVYGSVQVFLPNPVSHLIASSTNMCT